MTLWLDDVREPWRHGFTGAEWVKTADDAIAMLKTGKVRFASLDHDLSEEATLGLASPDEKTGYTVICWLEEHPEFWPQDGCRVHSLNPVGKARMLTVIERHYHGNYIHEYS